MLWKQYIFAFVLISVYLLNVSKSIDICNRTALYNIYFYLQYYISGNMLINRLQCDHKERYTCIYTIDIKQNATKYIYVYAAVCYLNVYNNIFNIRHFFIFAKFSVFKTVKEKLFM